MQEIWLEKYRPKTLDEVLGNPEIVTQFKDIVQMGSIPNMILSGPPGCGKTSSILCIARQMFGDKFSKAVLELNASDERGIDVVRNKVKDFAEKLVKLPQNRQKLIILDEADSMTKNAQQALRMIISNFSNTTRFVFCCNNSSKMAEALQSRCIHLRFNRLETRDITMRLLDIIKAEKIPWEQSGIEALIFTSEGDMRTAVNNLQATAIGTGRVAQDTVFSICDVPNVETIEQIVQACKKNNSGEALRVVKQLWDESFTAFEIINNIGKIIEAKNWPIETLFAFIDEVGMTKMRVSEISTFLQVASFTQRLCKIGAEQSKKI